MKDHTNYQTEGEVQEYIAQYASELVPVISCWDMLDGYRRISFIVSVVAQFSEEAHCKALGVAERAFMDAGANRLQIESIGCIDYSKWEPICGLFIPGKVSSISLKHTVGDVCYRLDDLTLKEALRFDVRQLPYTEGAHAERSPDPREWSEGFVCSSSGKIMPKLPTEEQIAGLSLFPRGNYQEQ